MHRINDHYFNGGQAVVAQGGAEEPTPASILAGAVSAADAPHPLSVFDLFRIGIGPSSSHTVGPMRAGLAFTTELEHTDTAPERITVDLYGSLAATGRGHNTDRATLLGLAGYDPETVSITTVESLFPMVSRTGILPVGGHRSVFFDIARDIRFEPETILPYHVNALTITAWADQMYRRIARRRTFYSIGGGFVMMQTNDDTAHPEVTSLVAPDAADIHGCQAPYPFASARELLDQCASRQLSIADLVYANERSMRPTEMVDGYIDRIAATMFSCIEAGISATGILPGGLDVRRRAHTLFTQLCAQGNRPQHGNSAAPSWAERPDDPMRAIDWVNLFALAVNEENASGHQIVTAPTNGAAGVIPAVLGYLVSYCPEAGATTFTPSVDSSLFASDDEGGSGMRRTRAIRQFLLAATAIGALIKTNASIAGAEVGCQGEVGSASAMAAAGLAQALGGSPLQVENAAEIAMEHSLGLTCDPVGGLVQVPCIERNAIAAVKAINAARMALWGDGRHTVSLDAVIETMRQTGNDMLSKYKETSAGGLAVNVVEC